MSGYIGTQPVPQATQTRETFTATASQTSFATGGYQAGYIDVFLNGVKLVDGTDFTATNGSDVVLTTGAASGDTLEVVAYTAFTVADQTFTGDIVMSDGLTVDNDGATVLTVDRATSDGTIIDVQKNGSSVGSIGTAFNFFTVGGGDTGLLFQPAQDGIRPWNTSSNSSKDAAVTLGAATERFKDLYLSGGVYLGGTGAANKLDDYEEGLWTPTWSNTFTQGCFDTATGFSVAYGKYFKVGGMVWCYAEVKVTDTTGDISPSANYSINNSSLPFAPSSHGNSFFTLHGTGQAYQSVGGGEIFTAAITPLQSQPVLVITFTGGQTGVSGSAPQSLAFQYRTTA